MLHALICACALAPFDFYSHGPYDSAIPRPEQILGYNVGERHTTFREQESAISQLRDKASGRIKIITYGKSVEGRPLRVVAIGSEANIARLDNLRQDWEKLTNPQAGQDTAAITKRTPALV